MDEAAFGAPGEGGESGWASGQSDGPTLQRGEAATAERRLRQAAEGGDAEAAANLGVLLRAPRAG